MNESVRNALSATLLAVASNSGTFDKVRGLVRSGADVNYRAGENSVLGEILLFMDNDICLLTYLFDNGLTPQKNLDGVVNCVEAQILDACQHFGILLPQYERALELLCDHGFSLNYQDKLGDTGLHKCVKSYVQAAGFCIAEPLLSVLLNHGASTGIKNNSGDTPLDIAMKNNDAKSVEIIRAHLALDLGI